VAPLRPRRRLTPLPTPPGAAPAGSALRGTAPTRAPAPPPAAGACAPPRIGPAA
jgi:hypothetical protein